MTDLPATTSKTTATVEKSYEICGKNNHGGRGICQKPAGWGTYHPGSGACRLHGGATPVKHGLYSKQLKGRPDIQERVQELKTHPELLNLESHLAAAVAYLEKLVEEDTAEDTGKTVEILATVIDKISKIKEREHKIQMGYYLSPEKVQTMIELGAARIQRTCTGCPKLPQLAADLKALPMPD